MASPLNPIRPDQITPAKGIEPSNEMQEEAESFSSLMNQPMQKAPVAQAPSLMSIVPNKNPVSGPSLESMQNQLQISNSNLSDMSSQIQTQGLKIRTQDKDMITKNMNQASDNLRYANTKLGIDPGPAPAKIPGAFGAIVSLLNDGSMQISQAQMQIQKMASSGSSLNPSDMLMAQVKINQAQQQIEFSSTILSKAVDDFKQLMNIQI